ncbi:hypothetical protein SAMN05444422_104265 [Halobiforma haloterrestris]|uniref:Cobalamin biosynthesis protein n=1 Tax=Natronobacterium haloterrestre TaxID=148448 RepID=A0A1I1GEZ9_NATHA|nr:cobalamin biosynthesis protein [Halobiforma haloterrestris]SFC10036.1 hypothetical protein SAMN05444422_104265 [Halobiforma haloterrestris]
MSETDDTDEPVEAGALEVEVPADPLAGHPASAYFWGQVAGGGRVSEDGLEVVTGDERAARVLAAIAGADGDDLDRETTSREYAHDASITRTEEEYTLSLSRAGDDGKLLGRRSPLGLPVDGRGNYRFGAFADYRRELLRGLLEGCGTICFKSSSGTVGVSFVHEDRGLLESVRDLIADCPIDAPCDDVAETSSGSYWFGVADDAVPAFGRWLYETAEETGLYAPSRCRKLERSLEQAGVADGNGADAGSGGERA